MNPMPRPFARVEVHMLRSLVARALQNRNRKKSLVPAALQLPLLRACTSQIQRARSSSNRGVVVGQLSCRLRQGCLLAALLQWD